MRRIVTRLNKKRVHAWLIYDLFTMGLLTCKTVSQHRSTGLLPATIEERHDVGEQPTVTMATEHAQ